MNQDYSVQFLKLVGKSFAWITGLAFMLGTVGTLVVMGTRASGEAWYPPLGGLLVAGYAVFYSAIPVFIFAGFVVTLRAFGRKP